MKKRKQKKLLSAAVFIFLIMLIAAGYYAIQVAQFFAEIREPDDLDNGFEEELERREKDPGYPRTNILLLGIDARTANERGRTDTIMILSFDDRTKESSLLSVPRDSRVEIPDRGLDKINHAHAFGGIPLTVRTVEGFLDVPIHYYARINFEGFERIVDTLGGVTINVESNVARNWKQLEPGVQRLNGAQALIYVRDRRSDSDIARAKRQQKFLKAVANESLKVRTITRGPQLLDSLGDNLRTNMPALDMMRVANMFMSIDLDTIPQGVIPGKGQTINGVSYWVVDTVKTDELLQELGLVHKSTATSDAAPRAGD